MTHSVQSGSAVEIDSGIRLGSRIAQSEYPLELYDGNPFAVRTTEHQLKRTRNQNMEKEDMNESIAPATSAHDDDRLANTEVVLEIEELEAILALTPSIPIPPPFARF